MDRKAYKQQMSTLKNKIFTAKYFVIFYLYTLTNCLQTVPVRRLIENRQVIHLPLDHRNHSSTLLQCQSRPDSEKHQANCFCYFVFALSQFFEVPSTTFHH